MSFAEPLYESSLPFRYGEENTSFHEDANTLRRFDLVEEGWRSFLDINAESHNTAARAQSAVNHAAAIHDELKRQGLDMGIKDDASILPILQTDTIAYIGQGELLKFYRSGGQTSANINSQKNAYRQSQAIFRGGIIRYLSFFAGRSVDRAYSDLVDVFDYSSLVVLGPNASNNKQKAIKETLRRGLPSLESRIALSFRGWAHIRQLRESNDDSKDHLTLQ